MMKIGFIGLGNMGAPMARNLVKAGHDVAGYDTAAVTVEGVSRAGSLAEAVRGMEAVVTMLPNGAIVRAVAEEILAAAEPGALMIDCSTIDVESARAVHDMAEQAGLLSLDAPVSGGTGGAEAGTLTFMVGGSEAAFEKGKPLFDIMGQKAVHCGPAGAGQAAKICNNMILGISMLGVCEAFHLADRLGLDRQAMFDVASTSSGSCWSLNTYCPAPGVGPKSPSDNGYKPGFAAELMLKDLDLSQTAADKTGAATAMGRHARDIYKEFVEDGGGRGRDFSAILETLSAK
ncbi:3-hydroxyisobutyrate dehydrogenase [Aurantimonas sp. VKM B-3413]|uniref:3-hydroxyisobutyrate dehydrogenase n=1 Tax=Aurantimonas sp. VKM B-3413 TaxID=2779401 RepID=UPI001E4A062A|nr:3-hydroxyisobutyrate dehydrogenase [Aurantimonas sp. VKM B-3413]